MIGESPTIEYFSRTILGDWFAEKKDEPPLSAHEYPIQAKVTHMEKTYGFFNSSPEIQHEMRITITGPLAYPTWTDQLNYFSGIITKALNDEQLDKKRD